MGPIVIDLASNADFERLKFSVASNPALISVLANCANCLGFAWCGGCKEPGVGCPDWKVIRNIDGSYSVNFVYDESQPYHDGYWGDQRLKMRLYDFKLRVAPQDFTWGQAEATDIQPAIVGAYVFQNQDANNPLTTGVDISYNLSQTTTHEESNKLGGEVSVESKTTVGVPFIGEGGVTVTVKVNYEHAWTNSSSTEVTNSSGASTQVTLPPLQKRLINVMGAAAKYSIKYDALATVMFKVDFENFLAWSWNAHIPHADDRPHWTKTLGDDKKSATEMFIDWWDNKDINGYCEWDFNAIENRFGRGMRDWIADSPVKVHLQGTFTNVAGIMATLDVQNAVPLDQPLPMNPPDSEMRQLVTITSTKSGAAGGDNSNVRVRRAEAVEEGAEALAVIEEVPPAPEGAPVLPMEHA